MIKTITCCVVLLLLLAGSAQAEELVIRHIRPESERDERNKYFIALLQLALEKTEPTNGPFRLEMAEKIMLQGRALINLQKDRILDVVWTMTSTERESKLLPIRIPLLKGLLGHRIFIINRKDREKFAAINTLEELKTFRVAQGHDWPDAEILKANGFDIIVAANYEGLFEMLERGRFDYFPRGMQEPWAEVRAHPDKDFIVEETLLLQYRAPIYFFVNEQNIELAQRIERGLWLAIKDGSFDELLYNHPITKDIFELGHLENRKIFTLPNPFLPSETPLEQKELWYTP